MITYQPKELVMEDWSGRQPEDSKPLGTWFSPVEEEVPAWREWCEGERWSPGTYTHQYKIELSYCSLKEALEGKGKGKVLLLSTEKAVWDLTRKFRGKDEYRLRWDKLGPLVSGVEINPYQRALRSVPSLRWYYPWDIASGCLWKQPEGRGMREIPLDWDGTVKEWDWC